MPMQPLTFNLNEMKTLLTYLFLHLKTAITFLLKHLIIIHKGTFLAKAKSALILGVSTSPIAIMMENIMSWSIANQEYIYFVLMAIIIDHLLGSWLHAFVKHDFSIKKNIQGLFIKIGLTVAMGFLFEGINHLIQEESFVKSYLIIVLRLTVFLYPAGSAFMNSSVITQGKFPPIGWINKIKAFNENLDLQGLKNEQEDEDMG